MNDPYDLAWATGAAGALARGIRMRVEAQRGEQGENAATQRVKAKWQALEGLASYVEQAGDDDGAVLTLAAVNRVRGGSAASWTPGAAQEKALGLVLAKPNDKTAPAAPVLLGALVVAATDDLREHVAAQRQDIQQRDLDDERRAHASTAERLQSVEMELGHARTREREADNSARRDRTEIDDLRQRLAGVLETAAAA